MIALNLSNSTHGEYFNSFKEAFESMDVSNDVDSDFKNLLDTYLKHLTVDIKPTSPAQYYNFFLSPVPLKCSVQYLLLDYIPNHCFHGAHQVAIDIAYSYFFEFALTFLQSVIYEYPSLFRKFIVDAATKNYNSSI